ncbi:MAG TPA: response regulator transcription factor [Desulfovibrio sp.]|jgi:DNA-binding response OmpR family regulator|uniref:winged helix-turn-helix domain-containing protein n=1 Tax=Desulfovibrio TaxID=872 RepID=UPI0004254F41|nr:MULTISPECIES: response regulator transcription factor [Desulfovibrio]MDY0307114.1 response regulator transcription factor [Desulfovibrionaceae bacterium]HMM39362.1 response regulator transcription factor [Desulfovibrio sp.]
MELLLVEDDAKIAEFIIAGMRESGYEVEHATTGPEGLRLAKAKNHDAAVIDIMLPGMDGLRLIEEMRAVGRETPVIILSAKRTVDDRVRGLRAGGDDYLPKPFAFAELLARVQALVRRSSRSSAEPVEMCVGELRMNRLSREVTRAGTPIVLQPREFALLEYLMRHSGAVLSKSMILESVWDYDFDPQTNVVDVLICRLRSKLDKDYEHKMLHTLRGVGYVLKP